MGVTGQTALSPMYALLLDVELHILATCTIRVDHCIRRPFNLHHLHINRVEAKARTTRNVFSPEAAHYTNALKHLVEELQNYADRDFLVNGIILWS